MDYMTSQATNNGAAEITVYFKQGMDPDMAAVDVQNRVAKAASFLPSEVNQVGVITQKRQTSMLMVIALSDETDTYDAEFLDNYMAINIIPQIKRVSGVGDAMAFGADYSMRIWLKPEVMAQYGLMPSDVTAALAEQNLEAAPGQFGEQGDQSFQYVMRYKGRLQDAKEFEDIIIRADAGGQILRLGDVAKVELGRLTYGFSNKANGHLGSAAIIFQSAGSNATAVIEEVEKLLRDAEKDLPKGLKLETVMSVNDFLFASIHEVVKTLIEAFVLVFLVVFVFLGDFRSTIIPMIAIPVALIGTFGLLYLFGFSLNLLTLSALVLAIAIVVDDAIVVVEAVHAKLDQGYTSARKASIDAMGEIASALISITLVMMLVFIPVSFMGGTSGVFYRQFGLTMAMAIGLSAVNALTLTPALCAIMLKPHKKDASMKEVMKESYSEAFTAVKENYKKTFLNPYLTLILTVVGLTVSVYFMVQGAFTEYEGAHLAMFIIAVAVALFTVILMFTHSFRVGFEKIFGTLLKSYGKITDFFVRWWWMALLAVVAVVGLLGYLMAKTPSGFVPEEDTGTIMGAISMPPAASQERTQEVMDQVGKFCQQIPAIQTNQAITGYSFVGGQGNTYGSFIIKLKHWDERNQETESADAVIGQLMGMCSSIKGAQIFFFKPPMVSGYSVTNGFEIKLQDRTGGDIGQFFQIYQQFIGALNARPEIQMAYSTFNPTFPQYLVEIDVAKVKQAGLTQNAVLQTLQGYYGGMYISNFNKFGKLYRVMMQAPPESRVSPETLKEIKIRSGHEMAPLDNFVSLKRVYGPDALSRFNMYTAISVTGNPAAGVSSGDAIRAIEEVAQQTLPQGYSFEYGGMTREQAQTGGGGSTVYIFALVLLFVYLILSAQYESYFLPWAVILSVPFGLMGTFLFALWMGIENNIYLQIALIMLMGLLAKNAILIVEFALERRQTGMGIAKSAIQGALARLRPILMTSLAMIIGLLPLMFAHGAGANGNRALGSGAVGGMLIGMILQVIFVPALFVVFMRLQEKIKPPKWRDKNNEGISQEL
ncbi:MAG: efflux RND transporter permease subunit, partial [Lachnospiraceae bacterium]|nr:efflux RND transporter permease subunit [Lachnospiraceae bacterium]